MAGRKRYSEGVESHFEIYQKVVSLILASVGIILILCSGFGLTGAIIGSVMYSSSLGTGMLGVSIFLFLSARIWKN